MKKNKLCECGCGEPVTKEGNRFICGHNKRNSKWSDEQREKMEKVHSDPEYIQKLSKRVTDDWKAPGYREILVKIHKKRMKNPDELKRLREGREKYWDDVDRYKKHVESMKEYWEDPENRKDQSERRIKYYIDNPEAREDARKKANKQWSDQEAHILASCGHQGIDRENWTGFRTQEKYCYLFNLPLKEAVRLYFNSKCFMDNEPENNGRALNVHHVGYDKRCGCDATQFCIFVPVKAKWNGIFNGNKEKNRWYWYSFLMVKIFTEHPNYFSYHIPVWGMNELEYNYNYVFEKFRR